MMIGTRTTAILTWATFVVSSSSEQQQQQQLNSTFSAGESSFQTQTECIQEGNVLAQNQKLEAAEPTSPCRLLESGSGDGGDDNTNAVCAVDYRSESAALQRECLAANGIFWERSVVLSCSNPVFDKDTVNATTQFEYWNIPTCLGASCNQSIAEREFDAFVPDQFVENFDQQRNLSCTATAQPATAETTTSSSSSSSRNGNEVLSRYGVVVLVMTVGVASWWMDATMK